MEIVIDRPPNYDAIVAVFPFARRDGVIFTYGTKIYNPSGAAISGALKCHESVHSQSQLMGTPQEWWERYLAEPLFRLEEELIAHRAEYRAFRGWTPDRNAVARELHAIAQRLAGPLYGGLITYAAARRMITVDVEPQRVAKLRREGVPA